VTSSGEDNDRLYAELDKVREGKGYIQEEKHKELMETQKKEFQYKITELEDQVIKFGKTKPVVKP
jgi:hypothetical protein